MIHRVGLFWSATLAACIVLLVASGGLAAPPGLSVTLTGLADHDDACVATFDITNGHAGPLDRFSIDVIALDAGEQPIDRIIVSLAPLPNVGVTPISLPLAVACPAIGRIMINDVPDCRVEGEVALRECYAGLRVASRAAVPLGK